MAKIVLNPVAIAAIPDSDDVQDHTADLAARVAAEAQRIAPRLTGEYADSIHADGPRVRADSDHAVWVEFGTEDTPTFAPLRRAADQVMKETRT